MNIVLTGGGVRPQLRIEGKVDALTCTELDRALDRLIGDGAQYIAFDCQRMPMISSAGLRVILKAAKQLFGNGQLAFHNLNGPVREIFEMAGFHHFVAMSADGSGAGDLTDEGEGRATDPATR